MFICPSTKTPKNLMSTEFTSRNHLSVIKPLVITGIIHNDIFADYDTLYCVRESEDNKEDEASNPAHILPITTTTPDEEETQNDNEIDNHGYDVIEEGSGIIENITSDSDMDEDEETTTENIKPSNESEGYGIKAILKYKIKKAKNTWSNIKNLLWYSYDR